MVNSNVSSVFARLRSSVFQGVLVTENRAHRCFSRSIDLGADLDADAMVAHLVGELRAADLDGEVRWTILGAVATSHGPPL